MSNEFISQEVTKIVKDEQLAYPLNYAFAVSWMIAHFKGMNLKIYNVTETSSLGDYFIIGSVENPTQAKSLAETLERQLKKAGLKGVSIEGKDDAEWILVDAGDIIIHIFQENIREIYDLDALWLAHPQIKVPEEYYYPEPETSSTESNNDRGYF
jgi:ribosome-associated protein